ncbi:hypothetical protein CEXT_332201 [Caerostris extrusa]|uniref:Uncharacterized protein n=1 Tax=Caerostris extrusa TaxID=172846 RepID=A0AAV4ULK5_CAEEX|nr:hypothetical protein CEXT_332201 [Caerostris extrusa]
MDESLRKTETVPSYYLEIIFVSSLIMDESLRKTTETVPSYYLEITFVSSLIMDESLRKTTETPLSYYLEITFVSSLIMDESLRKTTETVPSYYLEITFVSSLIMDESLKDYRNGSSAVEQNNNCTRGNGENKSFKKDIMKPCFGNNTAFSTIVVRLFLSILISVRIAEEERKDPFLTITDVLSFALSHKLLLKLA